LYVFMSLLYCWL